MTNGFFPCSYLLNTYMDATLIYALLAGIALVMLFVAARFALRWAFRLAIICLILLIMLGGAWFWYNDSDDRRETKPRTAPTQRVSTNRQ